MGCCASDSSLVLSLDADGLEGLSPVYMHDLEALCGTVDALSVSCNKAYKGHCSPDMIVVENNGIAL